MRKLIRLVSSRLRGIGEYLSSFLRVKMPSDEGFRRSVGGIRTSLYNAITLDQVQTLVGFMRHFQKKEEEIEKYTRDDRKE